MEIASHILISCPHNTGGKAETWVLPVGVAANTEDKKSPPGSAHWQEVVEAERVFGTAEKYRLNLNILFNPEFIPWKQVLWLNTPVIKRISVDLTKHCMVNGISNNKTFIIFALYSVDDAEALCDSTVLCHEICTLKKPQHISMRYRNWGTIIGSLGFNLWMFIFEWSKIKEQVEGNNASISGPWALALRFRLMAKFLTCSKISLKTPSRLSASLRLYNYSYSASYPLSVF